MNAVPAPATDNMLERRFPLNILVLNGSPAGQESITLYTLLYIRKYFPEHRYDILHVGQQIRKMEKEPGTWQEPLRNADLILFCYPVYTFLAPAQLHQFIELIKKSGIGLHGKYAAQITTSKHFYDVTAHRFIRDNCDDLGLNYISGLSADMEDLLQEKGRQEALSFFRYILCSFLYLFSRFFYSVLRLFHSVFRVRKRVF